VNGQPGIDNRWAKWQPPLLKNGPVCDNLLFILKHEDNIANYGTGFIPMIGYHHVLMIIIAVAIILLCECSKHSLLCFFGMSLTPSSTAVGWMLFIISTDPQHLPNLAIL
jgi:hypothetical protein